MIKKIVFDLDNTLIEWKDEYIFALSNVIKSLNLDYDDKKIKEIGDTLEEYEKYHTRYVKQDFLDYINSNCNINLPISFVDRLIIEQGKCFEEYGEEKLDVIKYLSEKYELICLSNWFTYTQIKRLEGAKIAKYFTLITGGDEHYLKPSLKAFDIIDNPSECVMIGDSIKHDILPALKLGMKAILITKKDIKEDSRYKIIRNLEELKEIL